MQSNFSLASMTRIKFGFGDLINLVPDEIEQYWAERPIKRQVHKTNVVEVNIPRHDYGEADGVITSVPGLLASIVTADCVPVLLAKKDQSRVAALHIGWRGAKNGMVESFSHQLKQNGDALENWAAVIGPAIGPCCFEVSQSLAREFRQLTGLSKEVLEPIKECYLDLPRIIEMQLNEQNIGNLSNISKCTACSKNSKNELAYLSHRRDGTLAYQWSGIVISAKHKVL